MYIDVNNVIINMTNGRVIDGTTCIYDLSYNSKEPFAGDYKMLTRGKPQLHVLRNTIGMYFVSHAYYILCLVTCVNTEGRSTLNSSR